MTPGCLRVVVPPTVDAGIDADVVADAAWGLGATAVGEAAAGAPGAALGAGPAASTALEIGFVTAEDAAAAAAALTARWPQLAVTEVDAGPALQAALEAWRPYAEPFTVGEGRLRVRPAWVEGAAGDVVVDPTLAFGYDHPSTRLCLDVVASAAGPGVSVLDVGCGSGVLAVAAAVLGASPVVAVDIDAVAVDATVAAARANGVAVSASTTPVDAVVGRFDLVLANIGARTSTALAPAVAARVGESGTLVVAGLLVEQVDGVVAAFAREGLRFGGARARDGWAAPVFRGFSAKIHH